MARRRAPSSQTAAKDIVAELDAAAIGAIRRAQNLDLKMPQDQLAPEVTGARQKTRIATWRPLIEAADIEVE